MVRLLPLSLTCLMVILLRAKPSNAYLRSGTETRDIVDNRQLTDVGASPPNPNSSGGNGAQAQPNTNDNQVPNAGPNENLPNVIAGFTELAAGLQALNTVLASVNQPGQVPQAAANGDPNPPSNGGSTIATGNTAGAQLNPSLVLLTALNQAVNGKINDWEACVTHSNCVNNCCSNKLSSDGHFMCLPTTQC